MLYPVTSNQGISYISRGTDLIVHELGGRVLLALLRENDKENEQ